MPKVLGLDPGTKRIGVAISDDEHRYAFPRETIAIANAEEALPAIHAVCRAESVDLIVIGLPLDQQGRSGKAAEQVKLFGELIQTQLDIPVTYQDERFTSQESDTLLSQRNPRPRNKGLRDRSAARIILQTYLDSHHG